MIKKVTRLTESALRKIIKKSITKVLNAQPMTLTQKMSLNEMSRINCKEMRNNKECALDCNNFYVYVKGEGGYRKFPHFHIRHIGEGWDIRMNLNGTLHSIKTPSKERQALEDFRDIEKIAIEWVAQPNALESDRTNGQVAEIAWWRNNE